ncbi:MAG: SRPBCC domain-containing protein [Rhodospirillaceae bacterium]|nr:MAG: SRPBCC domain-containing protein [Rhodospirillaceae bacterium]
MTTAPAPYRELTITRIFDAPRELVFKVWTEPKHLKQWWGPKIFTIPICEVDLRVGGVLRIVMHSPEWGTAPMKGIFREITAPERLVFTNIAVDENGNTLLEGLTTVTFADHGDKTKLTVHTTARGVASIAVQMLAGMDQGWAETIDKLETYLAGL